MADGYDRFENEGSGGGSFVMGLLTGTVLGAGLGMLFAPKAGSDLRNQITEQAGSLASTASEGYRKATEAAGESYRKATEAAGDGYRKASEAAGDWANRGRDVYDKARDAAAKGADEAQQYVRDTAASVSGSAPAPASTPASGSSFGAGSPSHVENIRGAGPSSSSSPASGGSHSGGAPGPSSSGPRRS